MFMQNATCGCLTNILDYVVTEFSFNIEQGWARGVVNPAETRINISIKFRLGWMLKRVETFFILLPRFALLKRNFHQSYLSEHLMYWIRWNKLKTITAESKYYRFVENEMRERCRREKSNPERIALRKSAYDKTSREVVGRPERIHIT